MKAEIVSQLANDDASSQRILTQFDGVHTDITKAIVNANSKITPSLKPAFEKLLDHQSYDLVEKSLVRLCDEFPNEASNYLNKIKKDFIEKKVYGQNHSILIKYLELSVLNSLDPENNRLILEDLITDFYEFRTRVAAMEALKRLGICNQKTILPMLNAMLSSNGRLAGPAKAVLKYFSEQSRFKLMIEEVIKNGSFSEKSKKIFIESGLFKA